MPENQHQTQKTSTPLATALAYAERGWPVFPTRLVPRPDGGLNKIPLVKWGTADAAAIDARDPRQIEAWWRRWPDAVISLPTGQRSGAIVLDIDCKQGRNGFDTLADLGKAILPCTPMSHTPSGGLHIFFARTELEIRNTEGKYGLGLGLDVRGDGGQVVVPSPNSGYWWDPHVNLDTVALRPAPAWLGHRTKAQSKAAAGTSKGARERFDPHKFLDDACDRIARARAGMKYRTYRQETFRVATLVRDGFLAERDARHALEAVIMPLGKAADGDTDKVWEGYDGAFAEGLAAPSRRAQGGTAR